MAAEIFDKTQWEKVKTKKLHKEKKSSW